MGISEKTEKPIRLLLVDDDREYAAEFARILRECTNPSFAVQSSASLHSALGELGHEKTDVVLLGVDAVNGDLSKIRSIQEISSSVPIIMLADLKDEAMALRSVREGAQDYLIKSDVNPRMITRVIQYAISRKHAEENIRKVYEQMETLLAALPSILIGVDPKGKVKQWNAVAEATFGVMKSQMLGKDLGASGLQWDLEKLQTGIQECFEKKSTIRVEDVHLIRGEKERVLGFKIIPIGDSGDADAFALLFGADITERKQLEILKDEFVSTVSHELRTPLLIIREGVALVLDGILGQTTDEQKKFLSLSLENIDRLARIINDLLDISKIEAVKMQIQKTPIDLDEFIKKMIASFSPVFQGKEVAIQYKNHGPALNISADSDKLTQIFTNLIQNSVKFTQKGFVEISVFDKDTEVECRVSDSGCGIAEEDLPRVFSKFQQFGRTHGAGAKGTGLGLSICKGLVELHGGKIRVESQLGKGTQFIFNLPKC